MDIVEKSLLEKVKEAQNGDDTAMEFLVEEFTPLIKKYSKLLNREDAFEDIRCDFIIII